MNYNFQSLQGNNKLPSSGKMKSRTKNIYSPVHNKEDQIFLQSEIKNQSLPKTINKEGQSEFNESKEIKQDSPNYPNYLILPRHGETLLHFHITQSLSVFCHQ